jgi:hypothetical protein
MVSIEFVSDLILPVSNRNENQEYLPGEKRPVRSPDNLATFKCRLSGDLAASTYWSPKGLSMPV